MKKESLKNLKNFNVETNSLITREKRTVDADVFCERFQGAELTHESLLNHENTESGWEKIFGEWKEKGYIE